MAESSLIHKSDHQENSRVENSASDSRYGLEMVASTITRMKETNFVQRKCAHCEEEDALQRKPSASFIQRKEGQGSQASENVSRDIQSSLGGGESLPRDTKSFMEARFNTNFSNVKIHTNEKAIQLSNAINARAFTYGNDIYFNSGRYSPDTREGKHLLAHELTHTLQQGNSASIQRETLEELMERAINTDLRRRILEPLEGERPDAMTFLSRLRNVNERESNVLLQDAEFWTTIRNSFRGRSLWIVFSILFFRNRLVEPHLRLHYAMATHNARLLTDILSLVILQSFPREDLYYTFMQEAVAQEFASDPLLPEITRLIAQRSTAGTSYRFDSTYREIHYESQPAGGYALQPFTGHVSANSYISGEELRVIVRLNFVDGSDTVRCPTSSSASCQPFHFLGEHAAVYDRWLNAMTSVWNNKFYINNGTHRYNVVFVPLIMSGTGSEVVTIRYMPNAAQTCNSTLQPGRSDQTCWFSNVPDRTVAHEFGHIIGASDEYNLPGTMAEISAAGHTLSAEDTTLSSTEGIEGTARPQNATGYDQASIMGRGSTTPFPRHLTRLINHLNRVQPPGVPPFRIGSR